MHHKSKQRKQKAWGDGVAPSVGAKVKNYIHSEVTPYIWAYMIYDLI